MTPKIGILGGMGPMATVDFVQKIVQLTPATNDQQHLPLLVYSVPQIPDRTACLLDDGESPLPAMQAGVDFLVAGGASCIAIPCNTAHYWQPMLKVPEGITVLHIAEIVAQQLKTSGCNRVGLMATDGTWQGGVYSHPLQQQGITVLDSEESLQQQVMAGIYKIKAGELVAGAEQLEQQAEQLLDRGAEKVIMACTEIPLGLQSIDAAVLPHTIDATAELAAACVSWYQQQAA